MLEYVKTILVKVSFNQNLFEKELRKSIALLVQDELAEFRNWCYMQFSTLYPSVLNQVFSAQLNQVAAV